MSLDADQLVDRRRLRRKLSFWRVAAFVLAVVAILGVAAASMQNGLFGPRSSHVARVNLTGIIVEDRKVEQMFDKIANSSAAKALIVAIDSPGGTTAGAESVFDAIRKVAARKPVVAQIGTVAASGGYAAAIAADHIVARRTSITGSIGVLFQWADVHRMLGDIGIDFETIKSGPLKAEPNPFEPTSEDAKAAIRSLVMDSYDWFVGLVADRRKLDPVEARRIADGRVYSGGQALKLDLIDAIGGEDAVRDWLATEYRIDRDLDIREWKPESGLSGIGIAGAAASLARGLGWDTLALVIERSARSSVGSLDGLVSVWQPQDLEQ
ncbi:signal peptide peptidase SppA [Microbaculum marinum]|uniref:Signal peptide peptidase SppA n=1 Tax=Microbaculum marinum TaxID=1764581 RepID=A0AAW9RJU3_9HYPH